MVICQIYQYDMILTSNVLALSPFPFSWLNLQNLLLSSKEGTPLLKIGDFGFARWGFQRFLLYI